MKSLSALTRAWGYLIHQRVRRFVLIPLGINITLFGGALWLLALEFERLMEWLLPDWLDWLSWLLWPLFGITMVIAVFFTFSLIANLIAAPFNSRLSLTVAQMNGIEPQGGNDTLLGTFGGELGKLLYLLKWLLLLLIITLIPGLNLISPFLWIIWGAWMLALEYVDYPLANQGAKLAQQRTWLKQHQIGGLTLGGGLLLITMVPGLNFLAMPLGVIAATLFVEDVAQGRHSFGEERDSA